MANWLQIIERGAGVAAMFVPNPAVAAGLRYLSSFADQAHGNTIAAGTTLPPFDMQQLYSIIPKAVVDKILSGDKVTIEIDGGKIRDAIRKLNDASEAINELNEAFRVK